MRKIYIGIIIAIIIMGCDLYDLFKVSPKPSSNTHETIANTHGTISTFQFRLQENDSLPTTYTAIINTKEKTIVLSIPYKHYILGDTLIPHIEGTYKDIFPANNIQRNFFSEKGLKYHITNEKGSIEEYLFILEPVYSEEVRIKEFIFEVSKNEEAFANTDQHTDIVGVIDNDAGKIVLSVRQKTFNYTSSFIPSITIAEDATVSPSTLELTNFKNPVSYIVSSKSGKTQKTYLVEVVVLSQSLVLISDIDLSSYKEEFTNPVNISYLNRRIDKVGDGEWSVLLSPAEYKYFEDKYLQFSFTSEANNTAPTMNDYVQLPHTFSFKSIDRTNTKDITVSMDLLPIPLYAVKSKKNTNEKKIIPFNFYDRTIDYNYDNLTGASLRLYFHEDTTMNDIEVSYNNLNQINNFHSLDIHDYYIELSDLANNPIQEDGVLTIKNKHSSYELSISINPTVDNLIDYSILADDFNFNHNTCSAIYDLIYNANNYSITCEINDYYSIYLPDITFPQNQKKLGYLQSSYTISPTQLDLRVHYTLHEYNYTNTLTEYPDKIFNGTDYVINPLVNYHNSILEYQSTETYAQATKNNNYRLYTNLYKYDVETKAFENCTPGLLGGAQGSFSIDHDYTNYRVLYNYKKRDSNNNYYVQNDELIDSTNNIKVIFLYSYFEESDIESVPYLFSHKDIEVEKLKFRINKITYVFDAFPPLVFTNTHTHTLLEEKRNPNTCNGSLFYEITELKKHSSETQQIVNENYPIDNISTRYRGIPNHHYKIYLNREKFLQNNVDILNIP